MTRAIKVTPEGEVAVVDMPAGGTLQWLYRQIGCHTVDLVRLDEVHDMWLDDEGMFTSKPNALATMLADAFQGFRGQPYYGTVILASHDGEGDTTGLSADEVRKFTAVLEYFLDELAGAVLAAVAGGPHPRDMAAMN